MPWGSALARVSQIPSAPDKTPPRSGDRAPSFGNSKAHGARHFVPALTDATDSLRAGLRCPLAVPLCCAGASSSQASQIVNIHQPQNQPHRTEYPLWAHVRRCRNAEVERLVEAPTRLLLVRWLN